MIRELSQMPTAAWNAYYDEAGNLMEGYEVAGEDAVLARLMEAWDAITESEAATSEAEAMEIQSQAAVMLQRIAAELMSVPVSEWESAAYISR